VGQLLVSAVPFAVPQEGDCFDAHCCERGGREYEFAGHSSMIQISSSQAGMAISSPLTIPLAIMPPSFGYQVRV
jgi:hypothetical protein